MNVEPEYSSHLWERALKSIATAGKILDDDPDAAANRAYYAAFHAVSRCSLSRVCFSRSILVCSLNCIDNSYSRKEWQEEDYDKLIALRTVADYGASHHVTTENARLSIERAYHVLWAVHSARPDIFPMG